MNLFGRVRTFLYHFMRDDEGQALLEYILMIAVAISAVGLLGYGFRKIILKIWGEMTCDISAACPTCPPDPRLQCPTR